MVFRWYLAQAVGAEISGVTIVVRIRAVITIVAVAQLES